MALPLTVKNVHSCPSCGKGTYVKDSRSVKPHGSSITTRWRRRKCTTCSHRFSTYEIPVEYLKLLLQSKKSLAGILKALADSGYILHVDNATLIRGEDPPDIPT